MSALAQPSTQPVAEKVDVVATERSLWLAMVDASGSRFYYRDTSSPFDQGRATQERATVLTAVGHDLVVFFSDGAAYRYFPDPTRGPTTEADLPHRELPLATTGAETLLYAIIRSGSASELPPPHDIDEPAASQPFDADVAPLSLVCYDGRAWAAIAPLPKAVTTPATEAALRPRLCVTGKDLWLLAPMGTSGQIHCFRLEEDQRTWESYGDVGSAGLANYWAVTYSGKLTFLGALRETTAAEKIKALRLNHIPSKTGQAAWQDASLIISAMPDKTSVARYTTAVAFNQHIGLLAIDAQGEAYLRFARTTGPLAESTLSIDSDTLSRQQMARNAQDQFRTFMYIMLLVVLVGLFVFRRGSMVRLIELPPGYALALLRFRIPAWLIDFVPFALAAAVALGVSWREGSRLLFKWSISANSTGSAEHWQTVFEWWALSVFGHTAYTLVMELITRRTVGKVLGRVHLLSESGGPPTARQIVIRNLVKVIELTPQFWPFALLMFVSRNHQRMGDIFARTIAVRIVPVEPTLGESAPTEQAEPGSHERPPANASEDESDESSAPSADRRPPSGPGED